MFHEIFFLVVAAGWTSVSATKTKTVQIDSGPIRGEEVTHEGYNYMAFRGIPFAAPPIGELRFKAPQPPKKWTEVRDTISNGKMCLQPNYSDVSSEDCLVLNVFTPSLSSNSPKAVLVIIPGGFFYTGGGTELYVDPVFLVKQDIVVVAFNYRLGALGFLSTNTADATGNWGLKDQVAALKWVQSNIAQFGGDPTQVTIYGYSTGSASAHMHLLSPLSKGLFQRAILSSGTVVGNRVLKTPDQHERYSRKLARLLGASEEEIADPKQRVEFLRSADPIKMTKLVTEILDEQDSSDPMMIPVYPFTPVIEAPGTEGAFITQDPVGLLAAGKFTKVPMVMGLTDLEGGQLYMLRLQGKFTSEKKRQIETDICQALPQPLRDEAIAKNECSQIAEQLRAAYFDGLRFDSSQLNFVNLWGDLYISHDMYFSKRIHAKYADAENPVYNYYFTFDGKWNVRKTRFEVSLPGAIHVDELSYLFPEQRYGDMKPSLPESSPEAITRKRLISFYTNFVKTGNPTPTISDLLPVKWLPSNVENMSWMVIGNDLYMQNGILKNRMDVWDKLNGKYGRNYATGIIGGIDRLWCSPLRCFGLTNDCD